MKDLQKMLNVCDNWGKYQKIVGILMIMTSCYLPIIVVVLPMNQISFNFLYEGKLYYDNDRNNTSNSSASYFCHTIFPNIDYYSLQKIIVIPPNTIKNWSSDLKLVCHSKKIFSLIGLAFFLGAISGYASLGKLPDRMGRETIFKVLNLVSFVCMLQILFLKSFFQVLVCAFVLGISSFNMTLATVILNENMDCYHSSIIMSVTNAAFPLLGIINTFFFYAFQDWRYIFFFVCLVSFLLNIGCLFFLRETPIWLYANNKKCQFEKTMDFISITNNTYIELIEFRKKLEIISEANLTEEEYSNLYYDQENRDIKIYQTKINYGVFDLISFKSIRYLTFSNLFLWGVTSFSFYGIFLNIHRMTGNIYQDALVSYIAEYLGVMMSGPLSVFYGRRSVMFYSFVIATFGSILTYLLKGIVEIEILMIFISAIGISSTFSVIYIYSAELFPTNIRTLSLSIFNLVGRLAAGLVTILLSYIDTIDLIIGLLSSVAAIIIFYLPESKGYCAGDEVPEVLEQIDASENVEIYTKRFRFDSNLSDEITKSMIFYDHSKT